MFKKLKLMVAMTGKLSYPLLQNLTKFYYEVWQVLQSAVGIKKYRKILLQGATKVSPSGGSRR